MTDERFEDDLPAITPLGGDYTEGDIQTLDHLEHIRQRPGMYIGRLGDGSNSDDGIYVMFKEVVDNSIDEYIMGYGRRLDISMTDDSFTIRDYGRGIPLGKLVDCVSKINTGGKFNSEKYMFSVGMNGVGTKAVNALSETFRATSYRDGKFKTALFSAGKLIEESDGETDQRNGTEIFFMPDKKLFPKFAIRLDEVERRLWRYAYLNSGLSLYFNNQRYYSKRGLEDLIESKLQGDDALYPVIHFKDEKMEFAFTHTCENGDYYSFVNGQYTSDGGTHLSAFKGGLLRAVNEHFQTAFDANDLRDGILGAVAVKVKEPLFESQTKNKLGNTDVKAWVENTVRVAVVDQLLRNTETANLLLEKIQKNHDIREEYKKIKKKGSAMEKR